MNDVTAISVEQLPNGDVRVTLGKGSKEGKDVRVMLIRGKGGQMTPEGQHWVKQAQLGGFSIAGQVGD